METSPHQPVLLSSALGYLAPKAGEAYLDLTAGYGGHAEAVLRRIGQSGRAVLLDRDEDAVKALEAKFGSDRRVEIRRNGFAQAAEELAKEGRQFDMVLMDLGVSSPQFDSAERGFSLKLAGPLDMRMDRRQELTAADIVNGFSRRKLIDIIRHWGEEPAAGKIADAIIAARPLRNTTELTEAIERKIRRHGRIHPATRTFQAIRIAVNDELGELERTLSQLPELMSPDGRLVIISFHSLEDRMAKQFFRDNAQGFEARLKILTKRPIDGSKHDTSNPRARSAKLRAAVKINIYPPKFQVGK